MPNQKSAARLRASPNFALTFTLDGRPYVAKDSEPYIQYWLSERDRVLLSLFSARRGATVDEALDHYHRYVPGSKNAAERKRLLKAVSVMREAGVLTGVRDDTSRYTAKIVEAYVEHRPFPQALSDRIIRDAPINRESRVLDLAGGPGDLALALARASDQVTMMDLSKGFVTAAARRTKQSGLALETVHDSANRLVYRDDEYDVVTVSQAIHWLDDVMVCRGLCRCLRNEGSFFVIQTAMEVADSHPLSYILGDHSILGHRPKQSFAAQTEALLKRLELLFEALDAPDVHRIDPTQQWDDQGDAHSRHIRPASAAIYRQRRPMDTGFVRAFLTPQHIAPTGMIPEVFWADVEARCKAASAEALLGYHDWSILHFRRGAQPAKAVSLVGQPVTEIGYRTSGR